MCSDAASIMSKEKALDAACLDSTRPFDGKHCLMPFSDNGATYQKPRSGPMAAGPITMMYPAAVKGNMQLATRVVFTLVKPRSMQHRELVTLRLFA